VLLDLTQNYFLSPNILASIELRKMVELDGAKDGNIFGIWIKGCFFFFFWCVCGGGGDGGGWWWDREGGEI
jgi:hypothetical protein